MALDFLRPVSRVERFVVLASCILAIEGLTLAVLVPFEEKEGADFAYGNAAGARAPDRRRDPRRPSPGTRRNPRSGSGRAGLPLVISRAGELNADALAGELTVELTYPFSEGRGMSRLQPAMPRGPAGAIDIRKAALSAAAE
jgi:hypothetical protein